MIQQNHLGTGSIHPVEPVVAGSYTTITFTYTAGHPIDDSGYLKIAFRTVSDAGAPQFDDVAAPNYCTVRTTGDCRIEPRWDPKGHTRPWSRALFLMVRNGFLDRGEEIVVVFGATSGGSPGWRMQTFCEDTFEFKTLVDPIATYEFKELPASPALRIVAGEPARAICIAPSQVAVGEGFEHHLKLEDVWGNPRGRPQAIRHPSFLSSGVHRVTATDEGTGLAAQSNPIRVSPEDGGPRPYWADFHGQSEETIGTNSIEAYFAFARDQGLLDIAAHQGNDFQVTDDFWKTVNAVSEAYCDPGAFVTFPGYEWSGNTPLGGDRNVYFAAEGGRITRSCRDLLPDAASAYPDSPTAADLFRNLRAQEGPRAFAFAHVGGRYADIRTHDPDIELAVEVHSAWGTFEWLVEDAVRLGYRIGICANSDGHKCRPGASYPGAGDFGCYGGLTCVLAPKLDRESILNALVSRHFYATTGNRCLLDVEVVQSDGRRAMMGDIVTARAGETGAPRLEVQVHGTAPIESVQVRNGLNVLETLRPYGRDDLGSRIKIVWSGAQVRGRDRMTAWDGGLRVRGNAILEAIPINFWNPNRPLEQRGTDRMAWRSSTTGGLCGVILTLADPLGGSLEVKTRQGGFECEIGSVDLYPQVRGFGGLRKEIEIYRLPDVLKDHSFRFSLPLAELEIGDNPIYVRVMQEDGHMAWSSPVNVWNR